MSMLVKRGKANVLALVDYVALRAYAGPDSAVEIITAAIAGMFIRDNTDTTSVDNGGTIIVDAASRRWKRAYSGEPSLAWFGTAGSGATDDAPAIQARAAACDAEGSSYLHIPNRKENYLVNTAIALTNPVRVFGHKGANYNRGAGKNGNFLIGAGAVRAFDLGNSRTAGDPADQWAVENIGFLQAQGVAANTKDGISFTSRTNGPDRGALVRAASFVGLRDAITVENADLQTALASLVIENSVFQGCTSALNAKGNVLGLRFVGNQCEQNAGTNGVLHGSINGGVTITDNMLEGQPNVVSIDIPPVTGNRPVVVFSQNYLEANTGAYVFRYRCSAPSALTVGPNFVVSMTAADYVLFDGGAGSVLFTMNDEQQFTLKNTNIQFKYGSRPFNNSVREYGVRALTAGFVPEIVLSEFMNLVDDDATFTHAVAPAGTTAATPYGNKNVQTGGGFFNVPLAANAGDLIVLNVLCRLREKVAGNLSVQVYNNAQTATLADKGGSGIAAELAGRWALVSLPFVAQAATASMNFRFLANSGTYDRAIAGIAAKNYGAFTNDGSMKVLVRPVVPNI